MMGVPTIATFTLTLSTLISVEGFIPRSEPKMEKDSSFLQTHGEKQEQDRDTLESLALPEVSKMAYGLHDEWVNSNLLSKSSFHEFAGGFEDMFGPAYELDACDGDDCEECEIPEAYKALEDETGLNVLDYLGIRRAEPIRSQNNNL